MNDERCNLLQTAVVGPLLANGALVLVIKKKKKSTVTDGIISHYIA